MRAFKAAIIAVQMMLITAAAGSNASAQTTPAPPPALRVIGFLSDFDVKDDAVGLCKAVMEGVAPGVKVIDITHQITPYDIAQGARVLAGAAPYFPDTAIFVVVVDPGVGSTRKAIIAKARSGRLFVLPDNGLLTLFKGKDDIVEARQITNPAWMIGSKMSSTFHGRDIFSPVAAHLARGEDWTTAGPALDVTRLATLDIKNAALTATGLEAEVIGTDGPYGNLVLNLPAETFARLGYVKGDKVPFTLDGKAYVMPFVNTFSDVPEGQNLLYIDSRGRLSIGINMGNFSDTYRVGAGAKLVIAKK
jgi:S-adenosylmethionine hydrolase